MNEPTRWLKDERTPRDLLDALDSMSPPKPVPPSLHFKLAARFAEPGPAPATFAASLGARAARLLAGLAIGGGVVFAAARGQLARKAAPPPSDDSARVSTKTPVPGPEAIAEPPVVEQGTPVSADPLTAVESNGASIRAAPSSPRRATPSTDTLAQEETILEGARRALATSPARALRLLSLHQRRFPAGELTAERLFLRADALRRLGRTAEARRQADALVKRFPTSAYARLVPALVASDPAP